MELLTPKQKKPVDMALLYPTMDTNRLTYSAQCLTPEATIDPIKDQQYALHYFTSEGTSKRIDE